MCSGEFLEEILDKVRREFVLDISPAIVNMHSLAGGTGSGLGTGITEELRTSVFAAYIVIAPYHFGGGGAELQCCTFAISGVEASHGVLVFENEAALT